MNKINDSGETAGDNNSEAEEEDGEFASLIASGPNGGNRAGGMALLAVVVVIAAALYYHFSATGSNSFLTRLDSDLLTHAELALASSEEGNRLSVVPGWPLRLYSTLRIDTIFYAAMAALAAWLWGLSARAKARRDAYIVHRQLKGELEQLRRRLDVLDNSGKNQKIDNNRKSGNADGDKNAHSQPDARKG